MTGASVGRRARGREVNGILILDKPPGLTSNGALQRVRRVFDARKGGHTGSLDPLATGTLPICLGEATKLSAYLLDADKTYEVVVCLGARTDTADSDGKVTETTPVPALDRATVEAALLKFRGAIEQIPPMYSALKHQGKRLYELARKGEEVVRQPRVITIHELRLDSLSETELAITVRCSKGTYVRTLAEDLAEALGTLGHVAALRRTTAGPFGPDGMLTLEALEQIAEGAADGGFAELDALLLPMDQALRDWPEVELDQDSAWYLRRGQPVMVAGAPTEGQLRIYGPEHMFLGLGEVLPDGRISPRRLLRTP
jgi:tRNA pseudouridine55 synthase